MILTPTQINQPRIVSLEDLQARLAPLCFGYAWAENAIVDLWLKGAPVPQGPREPERRILLPSAFAEWWNEIQQRMSIEIAPTIVYPKASSKFQSHSGGRRSR